MRDRHQFQTCNDQQDDGLTGSKYATLLPANMKLLSIYRYDSSVVPGSDAIRGSKRPAIKMAWAPSFPACWTVLRAFKSFSNRKSPQPLDTCYFLPLESFHHLSLVYEHSDTSSGTDDGVTSQLTARRLGKIVRCIIFCVYYFTSS
jgi:hypothetical protein